MGRFKNIFNLKKIKECIAVSFLSTQNSLITLLLLEVTLKIRIVYSYYKKW